MTGALCRFFIDDRRRLEDLLNRAAADPDKVVAAMPPKGDSNVFDVLRRVLARAGYSFDDCADHAQS